MSDLPDFLTRCIRQLQDSAWQSVRSGVWSEHAQKLAKHLAWRHANPTRGDGFDLNLTGDESRDRILLAEWLEREANGPVFCAPSWTRNFSELAAFTLRQGLDLTPHNALRARLLMFGTPKDGGQ